MKVGFIGTGLMGRPMAERLLAAGHAVTVWNRTRAKAEPLVARGAALAASAGAVFAASEATVLMLSDGLAVSEALDAAPDLSGRAVLQMSTIAPDESRAFAHAVAGEDGEYLEAPVLGSTQQAADGTLIVMAAGDEATFARRRPLLETFGPVHYVGEAGQAAALKLALNQLIAAHIAAFSFSLGLVRRSGVPVETFMEILRGSALHARAFDNKLPRILGRDYGNPNFPVKHLHKDVSLVFEEGRNLGVETTGVEGLLALLDKAIDEGHGELDYSAVAEAIAPGPAK